jgi:hypothetical protein
MTIKRLAIHSGFNSQWVYKNMYHLQTFADLIRAEDAKKIAELEAKNRTIGDESIYMVCQHQALEITELKSELSVKCNKCNILARGNKALNKIKGE